VNGDMNDRIETLCDEPANETRNKLAESRIGAANVSQSSSTVPTPAYAYAPCEKTS
jgi:hypothetical protein